MLHFNAFLHNRFLKRVGFELIYKLTNKSAIKILVTSLGVTPVTPFYRVVFWERNFFICLVFKALHNQFASQLSFVRTAKQNRLLI